MAKVEGLDKVLAALKKKIQQVSKDANVNVGVGFDCEYAVFVHENLENLHGSAFNKAHAAEIAAGKTHARRPQEQAKFLETPARIHKDEIGKLVRSALKSGMTMTDALMEGGMLLKEESLLLCPIDTKELYESAYVRVNVHGRVRYETSPDIGMNR